MLIHKLKITLFAVLFMTLLVLPSVYATETQPTKIEIGLYILDIAHLDVKESEFFADFYIWYKAPPESSWVPENIEFMNGNIESATPIASATSASGKKQWSQRIKGRFRGHFRLQSYPFDRQSLPIVIEDAENTVEKILFTPDTESSADYNLWLEPEMLVPDWQRNGAACDIDAHHYKTDFGLGSKKTSSYSRLTFRVNLKRLFLPHLIKFILPLFIIAGMAYVVFYINASEFEAQCGICITALLSAIALHNSQADALPSVGYLLMSDKIFMLFYVVIFLALVQTVVNNNYAKRRRFDMAIYLDKICRFWYVFILIVGNILIFAFS
ncbi:MAG TPA: hypothetical protein DCG57_09900 [Candidatus Riflebacteria bacterium]|jgi:hypothetical protein|nr:MAG: hypothetical protein CVV41_10210 [Candidatus Riflebacteria bacterium HGW-Riflebacteria-1]HAE38937.1 hypothetical protein [Candidatus Riflebacteria bacterium]